MQGIAPLFLMPLLASSLVSALATPYYPRVPKRDFGDLNFTTILQNVTIDNSTLAMVGQGIQDSQNRDVQAHLAAVNPNNATCAGVNTMNAADIWTNVGGDTALANVIELYQANTYVCDYCFGRPIGFCINAPPECTTGLRDLVGQGHLDTAIARIANDTAALDLDCQIGSSKCSVAPACQDVKSPAMWAVLGSLTTLHNQLDTIYNAMQAAQFNATSALDAFEAYFAPVPKDNTDIASKIVEAIVSAVFGLAGPLLEASKVASTVVDVASTLNDFGKEIADTLKPDGSQNSDSPRNWLPAFANTVVSATKNASQSFFSTGKFGDATLTAAMQNGTLLLNNNAPGTHLTELTETFLKLLFQQLAVFTWSNLQQDNKPHFPFIVTVSQPCEQVDSDTASKGRINLDSAITHDGACYSLIDAVLYTPPPVVFDRGPPVQQAKQCRTNTLPGGTVKGLQGQNLFGGLAIDDFIVPSVNSWVNNNKMNGGPAASYQAGVVPTNIQDAGAVTLPICDYSGGKMNAGKGCPDFTTSLQRSADGCFITS